MKNQTDIIFDQVSFSYCEGKFALRDVSLHIAPGEFVAVVGANGSGKTTLAQHVNALLVPTLGQVRVGGLLTFGTKEAYEIRTHVGMVFQNPDNQSVAALVADDVAFGPENLGLEREDISKRVDEALAATGISDLHDAAIAELSGGLKQRVAIAGVLAMHPQVLVLDEPCAMLDRCSHRHIMELLHSLNDQGLTIILVTHFMEDAARAERVVVLDDGQIACMGTPVEVFADVKRLVEFGLEPPFALQVKTELAARGVVLDGNPLSISDLCDEIACEILGP